MVSEFKILEYNLWIVKSNTRRLFININFTRNFREIALQFSKTLFISNLLVEKFRYYFYSNGKTVTEADSNIQSSVGINRYHKKKTGVSIVISHAKSLIMLIYFIKQILKLICYYKNMNKLRGI